MNYNSEPKKDYEEGLSLDTALMYAKKLMDKWFVILLSAILCAGIGFGGALHGKGHEHAGGNDL